MISSSLFLAIIYNQSQLVKRKHVARYWAINTVTTAVPLSAHPSPIEVAAATAKPFIANKNTKLTSYMRLLRWCCLLLRRIAINSPPASIKLTLVIRMKLAAAIFWGGLFGGSVLPAQYFPCGAHYCAQLLHTIHQCNLSLSSKCCPLKGRRVVKCKPADIPEWIIIAC